MLLVESKKKQILRDVFTIAIPTAIEFFLFNIISFTDNLMVSYLGDLQIAGVSIANKFFELLSVISFAVMGASGVLFTRQYATGNKAAFKNTFFISILIMLFFAFLFIFISLFFPNFFLGFLSDDPKVLYYGTSYLNVAVFSFLFSAIKSIIANALKIVKITKIQVVTAGSSFILNVILNYIFIFIFNMGVLGAAIATIIVRGSEAVFYLFYTVFNKKFDFFYFKKEDLKIKKAIIGQMIKLFIPMFLNESVWSLGFLVLTAIFARIDTAKYAAYSVTFSIYYIGYSTIYSFCLGLNIVMGREMQNTKDKIMSVAIYLSKLGVMLAFLPGLAMFIISFFAPYIFYKLEYSNLVGVMLRYYGIAAFFIALSFKYSFGFFRAGASPRFGALVEGFVTVFYTIPIAYFLSNCTSMPFELVVFIPALEDVIKLIFHIPYFFSQKWIKTIKTN